MKKQIIKHVTCCLFLALSLWGCMDIAYEYDIQSGFGDHTSDKENVTIDTLTGIDASMYDKARIFPGLVDTLTERRIVDTTVVVDLGLVYNNAQTLNANHVPQPIYSTGLYAGAGELVTIELSDNVHGLTAQIGYHMDVLPEGAFTRQPTIYTRKALFPGKNTIRNPFGGYIWISRSPSVMSKGMCNVKFSGVYRSPDYVLGEDPGNWAAAIRGTTVPWLEIRSKHVAFSVSRMRMEDKLAEDPNYASKLPELMTAWDNYIVKFYYEFFGLTIDNPDNQFRAPDFQERVVLDVELVDNLYMRWEGQPIVALNTSIMVDELLDIETVMKGNSVAIFTAIGNNYKPFLSPWWPTAELAAQMMPLYRISEKGYSDGLTDKMNPIFTGEGKDINEVFPVALQYAAADSSKRQESDIIKASLDAYSLLQLVQLANYNGDDWKIYAALYKYLKNYKGHFEGGLNFFIPYICQYYNCNFVPFMDHWGIKVPDEVRKSMSDKYKLMDKEIWKYNPLAENPEENIGKYDASKYNHRHVRTEWRIASLNREYISSFQNGYEPEHLIDGDVSTHWHTPWDASSSTPSNTWPTAPNYLVLDMKEVLHIDGIYTSHYRGPQQSPRRIFIQTTDQTDIALDDQDVVWRDVAQVRPFWEPVLPEDNMKTTTGMPVTLKHEYFLEFAQGLDCRYLRIKIMDMHYPHKDWDVNGLIPPEDPRYANIPSTIEGETKINTVTGETINPTCPAYSFTEIGTFYKDK